MDVRPTSVEGTQSVGGVAPAAPRTPVNGGARVEPQRLPSDAFSPTGAPAPEVPAAPAEEPPHLLVALEAAPARAAAAVPPDTMPVLEEPHVEKPAPKPAPVGVPLTEALKHAVETPLPPAQKAPEISIPEVKVGAPLPKPEAAKSAGPMGETKAVAETRAAAEAKAAEEAKPASPGVLAQTIRGLRRIENALLNVIGKGDPVLDLRVELDAINALGPQMAKLSDDELKARTGEFKARLAAGESLDDLRTEAYAVAREAAGRALGMKPYDVQVLGALAMGQNKIAEMKTGEGKTLTEVLPVYLNALAGKGCHVITVNETLAHRDMEWMGPVFKFMGLSVGLVNEAMTPEQRRAGYAADITYTTNTTLGFDYLRDQTAQRPQDRVQREPFFALVDEVDEVLIDEARTPLIISVKDRPAEGEYRKMAEIVKGLTPGEHFQVNRKKHQAWFTEDGLKAVEAKVGVDNLYAEENLHLVPYATKALQAFSLYTKDKDYIVEDGKLQIVDEFTGRVLEDRRYNDGLHQALEAREGLEIQPEQRTMASITYPNLFRRYQRLAGMSGTAKTEENEFIDLYGLEVVAVPTHKPLARVDEPDVVFRTQEEKFQAVADEVERKFRDGQPVLVGTRSIQVNEYLSHLLASRGIPHQVLNAKSVKDNTDAENGIIGEAGRAGMVTLATNMAGRGVDIKPDAVNYKKLAIEISERTARGEAVVVDLAKPKEAEELKRWLDMGQIPAATVEQAAPAPAAGSVQMRVKVDAPAPAGVTHMSGADYPTGGLFVLGTERHESRRIDDQLRGRSGRQGAIGGSRFYISLEDDLMRHFGGPKLSSVLDKLGVPKGQGLTDPMVAKLVRSAQERVEEHHFTIRKDTTKYDQVLNKHREVFYGDRNAIVDGMDLRDRVLDFGATWLSKEILGDTPQDKKLKPAAVQELIQQAGERLGLPMPELKLEKAIRAEKLAELLRPELEARYEIIEKRFGAEPLRDQERWLALQSMDSGWMNHLESMEQMQQGVGLVAYGEKDPWIAYQERAFELFKGMVEDLELTVGKDLFAEVLREVPDPKAPPAPARQASPAGVA